MFRLKSLKKARPVKNKAYHRVLVQEELEWLALISILLFLPFALCLLVLHLQNAHPF